MTSKLLVVTIENVLTDNHSSNIKSKLVFKVVNRVLRYILKVEYVWDFLSNCDVFKVKFVVDSDDEVNEFINDLVEFINEWRKHVLSPNIFAVGVFQSIISKWLIGLTNKTVIRCVEEKKLKCEMVAY